MKSLFLNLLLVFSIQCSYCQNMFFDCEIDTNLMVNPYKIFHDSKSIESNLRKNYKDGKITILPYIESNECGDFFSIINLTNKEILLTEQDGQIQVIREAKNKFGIWKPIEYWMPSWCGNSYSQIEIKPNQSIKIETVKYRGTFKTKIRYKIKLYNQIIYSKSYIGFINKGQFKKPEEYKKEYFFK